MNWNRSITRWLVIAVAALSFSTSLFGQVFISVRVGPPPLPVYAQPICPGPGYYWVPGYWAWNDDEGYYWVPGTWVVAPVGMLWTPGWWGWDSGYYRWHGGYWGPHVGFYGGINYGFGYTGFGFYGGEWRGRSFYYNRSVTNVSVTNVTNVYNKTVIVNNRTVNHVSYNGGNGGVRVRPSPIEQRAERERHVAPVSTQMQHENMARQNRQNFAAENHGRPAIAATSRPGDFSSRAVIPARAAGGQYQPPKMSPREARGPSAPGNRPFTPANSNNANRPVGGSRPTPQDRSGYRPFTPPNSNGSRPTGAGTAPESRPKSNDGYRPFTPPRSNESKPAPGGRTAPGGNPAATPRDNRNQDDRPFNRGNSQKTNQPPATQPRESRPVPEPRHQSAPSEPRREAAPPRHEAPAPRHDAPPPRREAQPAPRREAPPARQNPPQKEPPHRGVGNFR